jgi:hypothetical protein
MALAKAQESIAFRITLFPHRLQGGVPICIHSRKRRSIAVRLRWQHARRPPITPLLARHRWDESALVIASMSAAVPEQNFSAYEGQALCALGSARMVS